MLIEIYAFFSVIGLFYWTGRKLYTRTRNEIANSTEIRKKARESGCGKKKATALLSNELQALIYLFIDRENDAAWELKEKKKKEDVTRHISKDQFIDYLQSSEQDEASCLSTRRIYHSALRPWWGSQTSSYTAGVHPIPAYESWQHRGALSSTR